jgi:drug/metabolite transporter (DMT)-like permease
MPARTRQSHGLLLINSAVLLFGLAGVLGQLSGLPALIIVLGRVAIAAPALLAIALLARAPLWPATRGSLLLLTGQGVLLAVHWLAFFESIRVSTVAIGLLSFSSFPLFTAFLEPALLRQPLQRSALAGALLVIVGIALLVPSLSLTNATTRGVLWGLLAGLTFAVLSVANRWLGQSHSSLTISLYQDTVAALALGGVLLVTGQALSLSTRQLVLLLMLGLACTALAHTAFIAGLRVVNAQLASLLASLEPVWGIVFALVLLGETPNLRALVGGAIILLATIIPTALSLRASPSLTPPRPLAQGETADRA